MNPLLDERFNMTVSSTFMQIIIEWLGITAIREGEGFTENEGLCYEFCAGIPFRGDVDGELYIAMDGYTKLLLLPYIVDNMDIETQHHQLVNSAMHTFVQKISGELTTELEESAISVRIRDSISLNHKIVELPSSDFRKYMSVYFLKDENRKRYLGRIHMILALGKRENLD